jgi:hypothetical protein
MPVEVNETATHDFLDDAKSRAVHIVTERVADAGRTLMPVGGADPRPGVARANPLAGSWPPGTMKASVSTSYRVSAAGNPQGIVSAAWQYVFSGKKRHGIFPALTVAVNLQRNRDVP